MDIENYPQVKELISKIEILEKFHKSLENPGTRFVILSEGERAGSKDSILIEDWIKEPLDVAITQAIDKIKERIKKL